MAPVSFCRVFGIGHLAKITNPKPEIPDPNPKTKSQTLSPKHRKLNPKRSCIMPEVALPRTDLQFQGVGHERRRETSVLHNPRIAGSIRV